jgi:DNA topoisomerase-1
MNLVIVESPAKAKTINKYLGNNYNVLASYGHVRDLPSKNGSVDTENNFKMLWENALSSKKHISEIVDAASNASKIILATDPDREGEAIAWHVKNILDEKKLAKGKKIERVVFNEITKKAVTKGIENPREIDPELVNAYLARRALDYLVGFNISPILWTKLPGSKSAGRVQSVALRLVAEREHEIELFKPEEYWTIKLPFFTPDKKILNTSLNTYDGKKLNKFSFTNKNQINDAIKEILNKDYKIIGVTKKPFRKNPTPPFTTSTLQQEASRKYGFGASRTMQIAQRLYQGVDIGGETLGLITYMRTDGIQISEEAISACRKYIDDKYGKNYLPETPRNFSGKKAKNAQEAHEAIRPTDVCRTPEDIGGILDKDQAKLYGLIWSRTLASQMQNAEYERSSVEIASKDEAIKFKATGSILKFDGFLKLYKETIGIHQKYYTKDSSDDEENILPDVNLDDQLTKGEILDEQHFTEPPPRYSEASLVKKLEELGIGRPSTYASIISVLSTRNYVEIDNKRFIPTDRGKLINAFLEKFFSKYVDYNFTANLENSLDDITSGKTNWIDVLNEFWTDFNANVGSVKEERTRTVLDTLNETLGDMIFDKDKDGKVNKQCPKCNGELSLKNSRFGAFIGCTNYPDCRFTRPFSKSKAAEQNYLSEPKIIGKDESEKTIILKNGRFGPYLQIDSDEEKDRRNISIPKGISIDSIDLEKAKYLCSLPKIIGQYPENKQDITLNNGRFGPYLKCDKKSASLQDPEEVFTININRAIALIADAKPGRRSSNEIKSLGEHPDDKKPIKVMKGQYGPYVKYKSINATIPDDKDPEDITLEEALIFIENRRNYIAEKKGKTVKKSKKKK